MTDASYAQTITPALPGMSLGTSADGAGCGRPRTRVYAASSDALL